jgi:hypothetical protein
VTAPAARADHEAPICRKALQAGARATECIDAIRVEGVPTEGIEG